MILIEAVNVNDAYSQLLKAALQYSGPIEDSRLGPSHDIGLVTTSFRGANKFVKSSARALNPYFAITEACWVLAGRNDVLPLSRILPHYSAYSDDGNSLFGAYGHRLRKGKGLDQIATAIQNLKLNRQCRRVYLSIGEANDLASTSLDIPCNISVLLRVRAGHLDMTVVNRSNDIFLGVPYDWFTFSLIHEIIARGAEIPLGTQTHVSNSMHLYHRDLTAAQKIVDCRESSEVPDDGFDLVPAVLHNFDVIAEGQYEAIESERLRNFFLGFQKYKAHKDTAALQASFGTDWLGHVARTWAKTKRIV